MMRCVQLWMENPSDQNQNSERRGQRRQSERFGNEEGRGTALQRSHVLPVFQYPQQLIPNVISEVAVLIQAIIVRL